MLRTHVGEPLLDIVRRIIDTCGTDVELASAVSPAAAARRDNLDLFVKAVAEFQAVDGDVTLPALLAYLTAEDDQGNGLDVATPTEADSVKLLTVHRSKGLEWDARLPGRRLRDAVPRPTVAHAVALVAVDPAGAAARRRRRPAAAAAATTRPRSTPTAPTPARTTPEEELRLGYVAFTRAAHQLSRHVVPLEPAGHAVRPVGLPGAWSATSCAPGASRADGLARQAGQGRPQPVRRRRPVPALAVDRHRPRGARRIEAAALVRERRPRRPPTTAST